MEGAILAVDTAAPVIGAATWRPGGAGTRAWSARAVRGSDALLTPAIAELLAEVDQLSLVVVSVGPGAFTSLRVGVATALGLALARGCSVLPMSSLEARALARAETRGGLPVLAMLDGRKGRAYAGLFWGEGATEEQDIAPEPLLDGLRGRPFLATGEGAAVWRELVEQRGGRVAVEPDANPAAAMALVARGRRDQAISPAALRLRYLRAPDAKLPRTR